MAQSTSVGSRADRVRALSARLVRMHSRVGSGHLGSDLSCLPALLAVTDRLGPDDRLVLSKGHSALALYLALAEVGLLPADQLDSYYANGTKLAGHPPANTFDAIPFATGSLGHGLSLAAGLALAGQLKAEDGTVYCLTSDGEWEEGSTWEALIFACRHELSNLVALVDLNGWQALGRTSEVAAMDRLADRLRGFPVEVVELDGDDPDLVAAALAVPREHFTVMVLATTKGRGLGDLADTLESHYVVFAPAEAELIAARIEGSQ